MRYLSGTINRSSLILGGMILIAFLFSSGPKNRIGTIRDTSDEAWSLPKPGNRGSVEDAFKRLTENQEIHKVQTKTDNGNWRFLGVIQTGGEKVAIIEINGNIRNVKEGEMIPDQTVVEGIFADDIVIRKNGETDIIKLHRD